MKFSSDDEALSAAASDALAALTSLNRANTLSLVHEFVKRLAAGEARALRALDDLVEGGLVEARDDAAKVLLDQALAPALGFLRRGGAPASERVAAAALLGSIAEGRGGAASFLVAEGALPDAAALLADGPDVEARDAAARLVWALVKDQRALLAPGRDKGLGVDGTKLVEPLLELIELVGRCACFDPFSSLLSVSVCVCTLICENRHCILLKTPLDIITHTHPLTHTHRARHRRQTRRTQTARARRPRRRPRRPWTTATRRSCC